MRIAVIGQAAFGAAVYERLRNDGHEIVGVFTAPETGRPDALAVAARSDGVHVEQPARWQCKGIVDTDAFETYASTNPELNVMAFVTQIIPSQVLDFPPQATIQYHPSLLPKHRGAERDQPRDHARRCRNRLHGLLGGRRNRYGADIASETLCDRRERYREQSLSGPVVSHRGGDAGRSSGSRRERRGAEDCAR